MDPPVQKALTKWAVDEFQRQPAENVAWAAAAQEFNAFVARING